MRLLFLLIFLTATGLCGHAQKTLHDTAKAPKFYFPGGETHDFGTIKAGPPAEYIFSFKNTGTAPLIITSVQGSGGSEIAEWEKEPVLPGKKGQIKVSVYTQGRSGPMQKTFYVQSNAAYSKARYELYIKAIVVAEAVDSLPGNKPVIRRN